jgi:hypothetical protein
MSSAVEIIIIVTLILTVVFGVTLSILRRETMSRAQAASKKFPNAKLIIPGVNCYGQESKGKMQMRGNGTLVLTEDELYFEQLVPRREFRIPLTAVQAIETPSSFLGKTNFRPLLKVVFKNDGGQPDAMGWIVPDVEAARQAIEAARQ